MSRSFSSGSMRVRVREGLMETITIVARIRRGVLSMVRTDPSESGSIMHTLHAILFISLVKLKLSLCAWCTSWICVEFLACKMKEC